MDITPEQDKKVAQCWDENAEIWSRHVRAGYDEYRLLVNNPAIFELAGNLEKKRVLDAGCGEGYNTRLLARQGVLMTGVDISPKMIELARKEETAEPLGIRYDTASFIDLSLFGEGEFDVIISTMALMDAPSYKKSVLEFWRILRREGLLVFSITHPCFTMHDAVWIRDTNGEESLLQIGDYFSRDEYEQEWRFGAAPEDENTPPFHVRYFDRTLSDYINPLCETGFHIERMVEPVPSDEACLIRSSLRKHQRIPHALMIKASKQ